MKKNMFIFWLLILLLPFYCQKENSTEPEPGNGSHPQVDIPWPSLADSPWPMHHGNPQSTGRSSSIGPDQGIIDWEFHVGHEIGTSIAIGSDSTIYFGSNGPYLWAVNWDGSLKWKHHLSDNSPQYTQACSPLVSADGTIYIGTRGNLLYAVKSDGTKKWTYEADDWLNNLGMNIGLDGTIYFVDANFWLYAVNPNGSLKWKIGGNYKFQGVEMSGIAISPEGSTLYMGCTGTAESDTITGLIAVGIDGVVKWLYQSFPAYGTPLVDNKGNIYYGARKPTHSNLSDNVNKRGIFSITQNGKLRWFYSAKMGPMMDPTMDYDGNLYFAVGDSPSAFELVSVDSNGKLRWIFSDQEFQPIVSSLVNDLEGTIYFSSQSNQIIKISSKGTLKWKIESNKVVWNSPAIAFGRLLVGSGIGVDGGKLYCIK